MKTVTTLNAMRSFLIDRERTIDFMGEDARVYATPMLVRDIEITCREALLSHLEPGEDSVGTRVEIDHLAPSLLGATVTISARAAELKGRGVVFEITATDGAETVCRGRHARFVVDVANTRERLRAKQAKHPA
jgi:predicted thioesterase